MTETDLQEAPYACYDRLRAHGPVQWSTTFCGGAWLLTEYADIAHALRDSDFSVQRTGRWINSSIDTRLMSTAEVIEARQGLREFKRLFARALLFIDGPRHSVLRHAMHAGFKPDYVQQRLPRIARIVHTLIDAMLVKPPVLVHGVLSHQMDFMQDFARPLPALVIADLLGIPEQAQPDFMAWSDDIAAFIGSATPTMHIALTAQRALIAMRDYFVRCIAQKRQAPGDDLVSMLLRAQTGTKIRDSALVAQCCTLLFAGHETTRNLLGNGTLALLQHPEQWQALCALPEALPKALKELLRYDSPVQYTGRRLLQDKVLHGQRMRKGDLVILLIGAANYDPQRFTSPGQLDITRDEGNHLSFGYGPHVCIGASLTYLEAEMAFKILMQRLPSLTTDITQVQWQKNTVYRGLATFPVTCAVNAVVPVVGTQLTQETYA